MEDEVLDEAVPTEEDTLLGGESGNEFDIDVWQIRLIAGKYDAHIIAMAALLHDHGIAQNVRRWRCTFRDVVYTEEDFDGFAAEHAEKFYGQGWGVLTYLLGDNVRSNIGPARAILYGICRGQLGMDLQHAKRAIKLPAREIMACFDWYQVESPGKDEAPA